MLRKKDVEWIKTRYALHKEKPRKTMSNYERQRYYRLRPRIKETLEALVTVMNALPEQQLEQTFSKDNVGPFLKALFSMKVDDIEERRKRILELWHFMLVEHSTHPYVIRLVGKERLQLLTHAGINPIQALYVVASSKSSRLRK